MTLVVELTLAQASLQVLAYLPLLKTCRPGLCIGFSCFNTTLKGILTASTTSQLPESSRLSESFWALNVNLLQGKVQVISAEGLHQLHIFIFVMAIIHVCYSALTVIVGLWQVSNLKKQSSIFFMFLLLGFGVSFGAWLIEEMNEQVHRWKKWESQTKNPGLEDKCINKGGDSYCWLRLSCIELGVNLVFLCLLLFVCWLMMLMFVALAGKHAVGELVACRVGQSCLQTRWQICKYLVSITNIVKIWQSHKLQDELGCINKDDSIVIVYHTSN